MSDEVKNTNTVTVPSDDQVQTRTGTIVRTICLALALGNQILVACGMKALPISDDQVNTIISTLITVGVSLWTWWKNNSFSNAAIKADIIQKDLKNG